MTAIELVAGCRYTNIKTGKTYVLFSLGMMKDSVGVWVMSVSYCDPEHLPHPQNELYTREISDFRKSFIVAG